MANNDRELDDCQLDVVVGGMSCRNALLVGQFYGALGQIYTSLGMYDQGASAGNYSAGLVDGACGR
jgi:hypothetical protein